MATCRVFFSRAQSCGFSFVFRFPYSIRRRFRSIAVVKKGVLHARSRLSRRRRRRGLDSGSRRIGRCARVKDSRRHTRLDAPRRRHRADIISRDKTDGQARISAYPVHPGRIVAAGELSCAISVRVLRPASATPGAQYSASNTLLLYIRTILY